MAKTGMNIGADATIVSAAGNYAQAQVPFSMKDMADDFVTEYGNLMDTISTNFEASMNEINGVNDEVQEAIDSLNKSINDGTIDSRERRTEMQEVLDGYRNELKSIGKFGEENKKKREDLLYEVNKYIKDNESIASGYNELLTTMDLKKHSPELTGAPNLALIGEVAKYFDGKETDGDFEVHRENGELSFSYTYTSPDGTVTRFENEPLEDLNDKIKNKDTGAVTDANTIFNDIRTMSKDTEGLTWEMVSNKINNDLLDLFNNNPDGFSSIATTRMFGQPMSFYEALHNPDSKVAAEIFSTLYDMHPELDTKGGDGSDGEDGKITREDFGTQENYMAFVKTLVQPNAEQRNFAHGVAAKWYASVEGNEQFNIGETLKNAGKTGGDGGDGGGGGGGGGDDDTTSGWLRYKTSQSHGGGVMGGHLNVFLDRMIKGVDEGIKMNDGTTLEWNTENNSWELDGEFFMSGDEMLEAQNNMFNRKFPNSNISFTGEEQFAPFRGSAPEVEEVEGASDEKYVTNPFGQAGSRDPSSEQFNIGTAAQAPDDFVKAIAADETDVIKWFNNNKDRFPGLIVWDAGGARLDRFYIQIAQTGAKKKFVADPWGSDSARANEVWKWLFENYSPVDMG